MNELNKLKSAYPRMFSDVECGYSAPSGWTKLIEDLALNLNNISQVAKIDIKVAQVKEKFGGLRFYINYKSNAENAWTKPFIGAIIEKFERQSFYVCQDCGGQGEPYGGNFRATLCRKHGEERNLTNLHDAGFLGD